jgi:hypothetical protein
MDEATLISHQNRFSQVLLHLSCRSQPAASPPWCNASSVETSNSNIASHHSFPTLSTALRFVVLSLSFLHVAWGTPSV